MFCIILNFVYRSPCWPAWPRPPTAGWRPLRSPAPWGGVEGGEDKILPSGNLAFEEEEVNKDPLLTLLGILFTAIEGWFLTILVLAILTLLTNHMGMPEWHSTSQRFFYGLYISNIWCDLVYSECPIDFLNPTSLGNTNIMMLKERLLKQIFFSQP